MAGYSAGGPVTPVLVSYGRFVAIGPNCSHRWDNQLGNFDNQPSAQFGCAVTADIGVQIANPRDLISPAEMTPADNTRREYVLDKYRQGQTTSTSADDQASGHVSAVQQ
jgi:pilus assembly protein CpaD